MDTETQLDEQLQSLLNRCAAADSSALERLYELASPLLFAALTRILRPIRRWVPAGILALTVLFDVAAAVWVLDKEMGPSRHRSFQRHGRLLSRKR